MLRPPQNTLSYEQQSNLYLSILASPLAKAIMKLEVGKEAFAKWDEEQQRRLVLLGKMGVNLSALSESEKEDVTAAAEGATSGTN
jgi:hypothetical protein